MLVESEDLQPLEPRPNAPNADLSKYCPYHQKNGHTLEECFTVKDKIYDLNDQGEIMWFELKARMRVTQEGQQEMQIHQDPLPNHAVAHAEAENILSATRSELIIIQHIQADPAQGPPAEEDNEPNAAAIPISEVWSDEGSIKWGVHVDNTWQGP